MFDLIVADQQSYTVKGRKTSIHFLKRGEGHQYVSEKPLHVLATRCHAMSNNVPIGIVRSPTFKVNKHMP